MIHQRKKRKKKKEEEDVREEGWMVGKEAYLQGQRMVSLILTIQTTQVRFVSSSSSS